jgi:DNA-binding transcriptional regulator YiaG
VTPADIKEARLKLGLTQAQLAAALNLSEPYGKDVVRSWESGRRPISGPAQVAITLMLKEQMK